MIHHTNRRTQTRPETLSCRACVRRCKQTIITVCHRWGKLATTVSCNVSRFSPRGARVAAKSDRWSLLLLVYNEDYRNCGVFCRATSQRSWPTPENPARSLARWTYPRCHQGCRLPWLSQYSPHQGRAAARLSSHHCNLIWFYYYLYLCFPIVLCLKCASWSIDDFPHTTFLKIYFFKNVHLFMNCCLKFCLTVCTVWYVVEKLKNFN